jgi:hypothetical protein
MDTSTAKTAFRSICQAALALAATSALAAPQGATERVSETQQGVGADDLCFAITLSSDGEHVAFTSFATNLAPNDANQMPDVFVRRPTG